MDTGDLKKASKNNLAKEIASRSTDPDFYGALSYLPNPDPILRKLGRSDEVYEAIIMDAHVLGELRSVRAGMIEYEWRLQAGGSSPADARALELCEQIFTERPAPGMRWADVIWNMGQAVFRGYAVHEVVWERRDRYLVPVKVIDRPQRRFLFSPDNELRLKTRDNPVEGVELDAYKWLLSRHMPSHDNPYGVALLSSCFWPYTFKHSGFRYFVKFCEKYGIPWAIGRYPEGTPKTQQDELAAALAVMIEDAVAAIPDNGKVELLEAKHSGEVVHERMINICNREMSKALTSQTLATEIQGDGSRAASETHRERETSVNESDRSVICDTFNELLAWITEINIPGALPPTFEFYEEAEARQDWVEVLERARAFMDIPAQFAYERMQIPMPESGEAVLPRGGAAPGAGLQFSAPACPHCGTVHDHAAATDTVAPIAEQAAGQADTLIESMVDEVRALLDRVDTLEAFRDGLVELYPGIDDSRLGELTSLALMTGMLDGMDEAQR